MALASNLIYPRPRTLALPGRGEGEGEEGGGVEGTCEGPVSASFNIYKSQPKHSARVIVSLDVSIYPFSRSLTFYLLLLVLLIEYRTKFLPANVALQSPLGLRIGCNQFASNLSRVLFSGNS